MLENQWNEQLRIGAEVIYQGQRKDVSDVTLSSYAILNLRTHYALNEKWRVVGRLENITDREYELVHGYNTPGRSLFFEVIWQGK